MRFAGAEPRTVYRTEWWAAAAAAAITLAGVLAVLPLYRGWWRLGARRVAEPARGGQGVWRAAAGRRELERRAPAAGKGGGPEALEVRRGGGGGGGG